MNKNKRNIIYIVGTIGLLFTGIGLLRLLYFSYAPVPASRELSSPNYSNITLTSEDFMDEMPLGNKSQPLPHNGLFVRRNNQYGSSSEAGIKSAIEQGVLTDQRGIRFDDFSTLESAQEVSFPTDGQSLAVSYGIAEIPDAAKVNNNSTHYLAIALRTANEVPRHYTGSEAPSVNYIFVA